MKIKRVLHVAGNMNLGGAETLLIGINKNIDLSRLRFDYLVDGVNEPFYGKEIKALKGRVIKSVKYRPPFAVKWLNLFYTLKNIKQNGPFEAIHVHYTHGNYFYLALAWLIGIKKRISHVHTTADLNKNAFPPFRFIGKKLTILFATSLYAVSEKAGRDLYGSKPFKIIKNGIDTAKFAFNPQAREDAIKNLNLKDCTVLGTVSRLECYKNHTFLLDIFKEVYASNKKARLLIVGDGSLMAKLKQQAHEQGTNKAVLFLGSRTDTPNLLAAMDIFLMPSLFEGFGITAVEAQATGLPCLLSQGVPKEAGIVNAHFLPLTAGADIWAQKISAVLKDFKREDKSALIAQKGYDIKETAQLLQKEYFK